VGDIRWSRKCPLRNNSSVRDAAKTSCFVPIAIAIRTRRFHSAEHRLDYPARAIRRHRRACRVFEELAPYGHPPGNQSTDVARWNHERVRDGEADGININACEFTVKGAVLCHKINENNVTVIHKYYCMYVTMFVCIKIQR